MAPSFILRIRTYIKREPAEKTISLPQNFSRVNIWLPMAAGSPEEISALLTAWSGGDHTALNRLVAAVYPEMRRMARQQLEWQNKDHTLQSAALANEAYLKLIRAHGIHCENRSQFFALCAQVIRQILVDHARSRKYAKRGGAAERIPLDEAVLGMPTGGVEVLALDEALTALAAFDPRKARVVELRYFGGLSVAETAEVLSVSQVTVLRDWRIARTWLFRALSSKPAGH
jgi:RNA polymerase sigma factor (TIGR02999 family)